jgi:hypothetical protein
MNSDRPSGRGELPGDRPTSTSPEGERTLRDDLREARLRDRLAEGSDVLRDSRNDDGPPGGTADENLTTEERALAGGTLPGEIPGLVGASDGMLDVDLRRGLHADPREDRLGDRVDDPVGGDTAGTSPPEHGALGAHPVGTAIGAVGGAVAVGAAIGTIAGPVGTAVGAALGAAAGALTGKGVADMADPQGENDFWRTNWRTREYADSTLDFDRDYSPAYRYGVDAYSRYPERHYDEIETDLSSGWTAARGESRLEWEHARQASRDAWLRMKEARERELPPDIDGD